jgi:hypothetical protein
MIMKVKTPKASMKPKAHPTDFMLDSSAALTGINQKFADYFGIKIDPARTMRITTAYDQEVDAPIGIVEEIRKGGN